MSEPGAENIGRMLTADPTREPSVTANEAAVRPDNVAAEDLRATIRALPTGRYAMLADLDVALRTERLRVVEQIRAVTLPFVEHTDMGAAMACHTALHAILDAVAGLSGEEPSE